MVIWNSYNNYRIISYHRITIYLSLWIWEFFQLPSGNWTVRYSFNHHFEWENPLFRLGHGFNSYVSHYHRVCFPSPVPPWFLVLLTKVHLSAGQRKSPHRAGENHHLETLIAWMWGHTLHMISIDWLLREKLQENPIFFLRENLWFPVDFPFFVNPLIIFQLVSKPI